jgi:hypothetical protein
MTESSADRVGNSRLVLEASRRAPRTSWLDSHSPKQNLKPRPGLGLVLVGSSIPDGHDEEEQLERPPFDSWPVNKKFFFSLLANIKPVYLLGNSSLRLSQIKNE